MNNLINRRIFVNKSLNFLTGLTLGSYLLSETALNTLAVDNQYLKKAYFYQNLTNKFVKCTLCPNFCIVGPNKTGKCRGRKNINGDYYSTVYSRPAVIKMDEVEKAPLYHFNPGIKMLSLATTGCNLTCKYCQNWQFSQSNPKEVETTNLTPAQVIQKAKQANCKAVSLFYTEPTIYYEYMYDIALLAKKAHLKTIMVTAGYINLKPLNYLCNIIDAFTIGLKGFNEQYYRSIIGGSLEPVKSSIKYLKERRKHFEIVSLIVPTLNDSTTEINNSVKWIKTTLGDDVPLHFARFVPEYKLLNLAPTSINALNNAIHLAKKEGLKYVYIDNLPGHEAQNTLCPGCNKTIMRRVGFKIIENKILNSKCPHCGSLIKGEWN